MYYEGVPKEALEIITGSPRCGECKFWMSPTQCKRERDDGLHEATGPHALRCNKFQPSEAMERMLEDLTMYKLMGNDD